MKKDIRTPPKRLLFSRAPLAVACAMIGSGNCLAQPVDHLPSPLLQMALQMQDARHPSSQDRPVQLAQAGVSGTSPDRMPGPALRMAVALATKLEQVATAPCKRKPLVLAQAWIPGLQPGSGLLMSDVYAPLLEIAETEPCDGKPLLLALADTTLAGMPVAAAATPRPGQGKSALVMSAAPYMQRQDGYLLLAQADTTLTGTQVSPAAAPRPGQDKSALVMSASPFVQRQDEVLQLAQADVALAGMQVASSAAPRPDGQDKSALILSSPADMAQPRRNRASATANMKLAQGPANGNGNGHGAANGEGAMGSGLWQIPPIRWGGDVSLDVMTNTSQGARRTTQVFEAIGVHADSYIYQPWFSRVNGGLRLMKFNNGLTKGLSTEDGGTTTVTGDGSLTLFPVSRFPFTAAYNVSDSTTSGQLISNGYTSRRLSLSQSYAPKTGSANYTLNFDHSTIDSDSLGRDIANSLTGYMSDRSNNSDYNLNFGHYTNKHEQTGDKSEIDSLGANYNLRPSSNLSINNLVNLGKSNFDLAGPAKDSNNRYFQVNSFATWRPEDNSPLMVSGGARLYQSTSGVSGTETDSRTVSGNAAASYELNRNVTLTAAGTLTDSKVNDIDTRLTYLSGEANYNADLIRFGEYNYGWGGAAYTRYDSQSGVAESSHSTSGARIRHNIGRTFQLADNSSVNAYAGQAISKDFGYLSYVTLANNGGVSWSIRPSDRTSTMFGVNVADNNSWGEAGARQHFQMINLQGNGQIEINRYSSGGVNMTVQGTRQVVNSLSSAAQNDGFNWSTNGNLYYQHMQAFGVPRLRYSATLDVNQFKNQSRLEGNINAPVEHVNKSFEQRFDYDIGRTSLQLRMRYADIEGRNSSMIYFRIVRQFGGY